MTRPNLFERSKHRRSFVTLRLAESESETWIMDRTGHRSSVMVQNYRQLARLLAELHLDRPKPLDEVIPELSESNR